MQFRISLLAVVSVATSHGALVITEVMSNSDHPGGAANGDWFEITNAGTTSIDLTNYYWDDGGPSANDGALFPSLVINPGQSIVIVDENLTNLVGFVAAWGGGFTAVSGASFTGPNTFSGLDAGGDQIQIWDANPNAGPANLVASVTFGDSAGGGRSFEWDLAGNSLGFSAVGENGAFLASGNGAGGTGIDIGSPGLAVPEPSALLLGGMGLLALVRRRR